MPHAVLSSSSIANLTDPSGNLERQRAKLDGLRQLNELHRRERANESQLDARIASFELAFRMQRDAPEAFDISLESQETQKLYGVDDPETEFGPAGITAGNDALSVIFGSLT